MPGRARVLSLALATLLSTLSLGAGSGSASPPERPVPWRVTGAPPLPGGERVTAVADPSTGAVALGEWREVPRPWPIPTAGGGLAFDEARGEVVTFGGCCFHGETWLWKGGDWRRAEPVIAPDARAGNVMAYDPIREETVMFGGSDLAETWTWDGEAWELHAAVPSPPFRSDAAMAFLPKLGKVVLFGGYPEVSAEGLGTQLGDTWAWDGSAWERIDTDVSPPDRYAPGLALDPVSGDLVLFGGMSDTYASLSDTWTFDGTGWRPVETDVAPPARSYMQMAGNPAAGAVELFGGYAREDGLATLSDRWWFVDGRWTEDLPGVEEGDLPPGRLAGGMVSTEGAMVLYGGNCEPTCGGVWTERLVETEGVERRLEWQQTSPPWPPNRMSAGTMVEDPLGRGTLMHGGFGDSTGAGHPNDTWVWDGRWRLLDTTGAPPGRQGPALAAHPETGTVVLFGGLIGYQHRDDTTWVLDGDRWVPRRPATSPPGRYHAAMAEDPDGDVVLFGGFDAESAKLGDTWTWDGETWTDVSSSEAPSARAYPQMVYDPVRNETVLFGGSDAAGATPPETWVWDGEAWEQRSPAVSPPGRLGAAMAWDPASERIVLFGGATCVNVACAIGSDVWTWDGSTWTKHEAPGGWPSARWYSLAGPAEDGIVMFGGHGGGTGLPLADTWLWRAAP